MPGFRRVSEEELLRAWLFRVDRFHLLDPDGKPFDRFGSDCTHYSNNVGATQLQCYNRAAIYRDNVAWVVPSLLYLPCLGVCRNTNAFDINNHHTPNLNISSSSTLRQHNTF